MNIELIEDILKYVEENERFLNELYDSDIEYPDFYKKLLELRGKIKVTTDD